MFYGLVFLILYGDMLQYYLEDLLWFFLLNFEAQALFLIIVWDAAYVYVSFHYIDLGIKEDRHYPER